MEFDRKLAHKHLQDLSWWFGNKFKNKEFCDKLIDKATRPGCHSHTISNKMEVLIPENHIPSETIMEITITFN